MAYEIAGKYIAFNPDRLVTGFYASFDYDYWRYKLEYLRHLVNLESPPVQQLGLGPELEPERWERYLAQEVHFCYYHITECLFALLFAKAQERPPEGMPIWLYLTEYQPRGFGHLISEFLNRDYEAPFKCETFAEFAAAKIYGGIDTGLDEATWSENCDKLEILLRMLATDLRDNKGEYNSYKHGLRAANSVTKIAYQADGSEQIFLGGSNPNSSVFLATKDCTEYKGKKQVYKVTKGFSPTRSLNLAVFAFQVIDTLIQTNKPSKAGDQVRFWLFHKHDTYQMGAHDPGYFSATTPI